MLAEAMSDWRNGWLRSDVGRASGRGAKLSDMQDERAQRGMTSDGRAVIDAASDSPEPTSDERKGWWPGAPIGRRTRGA
jgi:hypothetical protein